MTWLDEIVNVLKSLGGKAHLKRIYDEVSKRGNMRQSIEVSDWQATIRQTIYDHSSDSKSFRAGKDIFYSVELRSGRWGLRKGVFVCKTN